MKCLGFLSILAVLTSPIFFSSCNSDVLPDNAPKLIDADGNAYVACEGLVWVSTQNGGMGGVSFSIKFTEKGGISRDLRGIKKLDISDVPKGFDPCKLSPQTETAEQGFPGCANGYVLYSDVRSYAKAHDESVSDVGDRVQQHRCKIVDSLPSQ
jgi:hypothetical protein